MVSLNDLKVRRWIERCWDIGLDINEDIAGAILLHSTIISTIYNLYLFQHAIINPF